MTGVSAAIAAWIAEAQPHSRELCLPETIADDLGVTRRAVEKALARLEDEGVLVWHRKPAGGKRQPWYVVSAGAQTIAKEAVR